MFDPKFLTLAQVRCEEMKRDVNYERLIHLYEEKPPMHGRILAGAGRLLVKWGTSLQKRYDKNMQQRPVWVNANRRMGRVS